MRGEKPINRRQCNVTISRRWRNVTINRRRRNIMAPPSSAGRGRRRRGSNDVVVGGGTADGQSSSSGRGASSTTTTRTTTTPRRRQRSGRVVHVVPPRSGRTAIVGPLLRLPGGGNGGNDGRYMLVPNNKSLPRFVCPSGTTTMTMTMTTTTRGAEMAGRGAGRRQGRRQQWATAPPCRSFPIRCNNQLIGDSLGTRREERGAILEDATR